MDILTANRLATPDEKAEAWRILMASTCPSLDTAVQQACNHLCVIVNLRVNTPEGV